MPALSLQTLCRCCNNPTEQRYQPNWNPEMLGSDLVTCRTEGCALYGQTFDSRDYATVNLNLYVVSRAPRMQIGQVG